MQQTRLRLYMDAIELVIDDNGLSLDFGAMRAMLCVKLAKQSKSIQVKTRAMTSAPYSKWMPSPSSWGGGIKFSCCMHRRNQKRAKKNYVNLSESGTQDLIPWNCL